MQKSFFLMFFLVLSLCFSGGQLVFAEDIISHSDSQKEDSIKTSELSPQNALQIQEEFREKKPEEKIAISNFDLKERQLDDDEENIDSVADPLYYMNYGVFHFNDFLQVYALEPVAKGYKYITPEIARVGVGNFFNNLTAPVNMFNNLLQLKPDYSGLELLRFVINTTIGVGGFYDAADHLFDIKKKEAGFGQTLGYYGIGHGVYIVWPIFGPSSIRETVGFAGDKMMSPATYIGYFYLDFYQSASITTFEKINDTSFKLGDYKLLVGNAIEPYDALKDAFEQYTKKRVKKVSEL